MSPQPFRRAEGGLIDRTRPLEFTFDGRALSGYQGDTVASALLANGVRLVGRSFKYHRPRGVVGAGPEEPNALITVGTGAASQPNTRATQAELFQGLSARSQNRWPSLALDLGSVSGWFSPLLPAGFYYKTFMWPAGAWMLYERFIRGAAGLGAAPRAPDPDRYEHRHWHGEILVVGGGVSGLAAALAAGRAGARVLLVEDEPRLGGWWRGAAGSRVPEAARRWLQETMGELGSLPNVQCLTRTTAFGYYDHNLVALCERVTDHLASPAPELPRQRLWLARAQEVVLATGTIERPLVFAGNDRPGVMLASAAQRYANEFAVRVARRAVVFTNNDSAYTAALDLVAAGLEVPALVDAREEGGAPAAREALAEAGVEVIAGHAVSSSVGQGRVRAAKLHRLSRDGRAVLGEGRRLACDAILVSGGWSPTVHLYAHAQGQLRWDPGQGAFLPGPPPAQASQRLRPAGAAAGRTVLAEALLSGVEAARAAVQALGRRPVALELPALAPGEAETPMRALWLVPQPGLKRGKRFVDLQNDVTAEDIGLAVREGYRSVEHLKRYTTLGMGTDQGRLSNVNGLASLAAERGEAIPEVGFTTFRPPYAPVTLGALAGEARGAVLAPERRTPMHDWHVGAGAEMATVGRWWRPQCYPRAGEPAPEAVSREARAVREGVGLVDVSTLGKIELIGRDAAAFLERVYLNRWRSLRVGRARYGIMLREDGMVLDDGTTTRIGEHHYYMTTTTAHAEEVMAHLEFHAQTSWPELDLDLFSVSDQWAAAALAGPRSRVVLAAACDRDVGDNVLPHLGYLEASVARIPVRIFRLTFSGELAYELHTPADYGTALWEALLAAGREHGIVPYGTEAMGVLRIEKGHVVSAELDGRTTPDDVGFAGLARPDSEFIGYRGLQRPALQRSGRLQLVGLRARTASEPIPRGGHLLAEPFVEGGAAARRVVTTEGHVTSIAYSPSLRCHIALALVRDGRGRHGEFLVAASPLAGVNVTVEVVDPAFIDPAGERPRG